jgi:arginine deiminase
MSAVRVNSEIGRLRRVMLHRPGGEIDRMVPAMMERLLFDDILDGERARTEHGHFRSVLEQAGVEVLDAADLLGEVLVDAAARTEVLEELGRGYGTPQAVLDQLGELEPATLARSLIAGLRLQAGRAGQHGGGLPGCGCPLPAHQGTGTDIVDS